MLKEGENGTLSKATQIVTIMSGSPPRTSPEKEGPESHCWLQPADPSSESALNSQSPCIPLPRTVLQQQSARPRKGGVWVSQADSINSDFQHQMSCRLLFLSLLLWMEDAYLGLRPHTPGGREVSSHNIPLAATAPGCGG